jgi:hypothetical protein
MGGRVLMARASICVQRDKTTYRLAWFTESKAGIYFGHIGSDKDYHHSYHTDGIRHYKAGRDTHFEVADTPLFLHTGYRQLLNSNCALSPVWLNARTKYTPPNRAETVITVDEAAAAGKDSLLTDWYLTEDAAEPKLRTMLETLARNGQHQQLTLTGIYSVPLDHYLRHLVCFAVWVGNTRRLGNGAPP